ncbi:MAG: DUF2851 family protein [Thermomicrobiales bacterium]
MALSAAWHAGRIPDLLTTADGETIQVVHRGAWTHGLGPDFADALLLFNDRELRSGSVEMHLRTRGWFEHGHHLDPAYNAVILHVVAQHDGTATRRADGRVAPVVQISDLAPLSHPLLELDWNRIGGAVCATRLVATDPRRVAAILQQLGDVRLSARSARIEAKLTDEPAGEVLWQGVLGGLGYSRNSAPMRVLAERVPISGLERTLLTRPGHERHAIAQGLLLGAAGFLPLSPAEASLAQLSPAQLGEIERQWAERGGPWQADPMPSEQWDRARSRPANHPLSRLLAAAALAVNAAAAGGILTMARGVVEALDPVTALRDLTASPVNGGIGEDRAIEILASAVLPALLAVAAHTGDDGLAEAAASAWNLAPAPAANSVTKRAMQQVAGAVRLRGIGARGSQGLIHLDTVLCQPRRCFECPIARAELAVND